jgi:hypothetical protein
LGSLWKSSKAWRHKDAGLFCWPESLERIAAPLGRFALVV